MAIRHRAATRWLLQRHLVNLHLTGGGREFSPHQFNVGYTLVRCPMLDFISIGYVRALAQCADVAPLRVHIYVLFSAGII